MWRTLHTTQAYAIPFFVDRLEAPHRYQLVNMSDETVHGLVLTHLGSGYCPPLATRRLEAYRGLTIAVFGAGITDTGVVVVRWRRPNREEYVWRMSLGAYGLAA